MWKPSAISPYMLPRPMPEMMAEASMKFLFNRQWAITSPRLRGEVEAEAQRRLRVRGTLHALGFAESPPPPAPPPPRAPHPPPHPGGGGRDPPPRPPPLPPPPARRCPPRLFPAAAAGSPAPPS